MSINLSVNVNKIATLRNSRGGNVPSVTDAVTTCLEAGAPGITVHPRADERHIRPADVRAIAAQLAEWRRRTGTHPEFNIEGDPRPDLIDMTLETRPDQCTLVPVTPGEITSHAGWATQSSSDALAAAIRKLQPEGRLATLGLAVPNLFVLPFGTALGVYAFWVLLHDETRKMFGIRS